MAYIKNNNINNSEYMMTNKQYKEYCNYQKSHTPSGITLEEITFREIVYGDNLQNKSKNNKIKIRKENKI